MTCQSLAILVLATLTLSGCAPSKPPAPHPQQSQQQDLDPCLERLQDISGMLLQYYAIKHELPPTLEDLAKVTTGQSNPSQFTCPLSGQPYEYYPNGLQRMQVVGHVIVVDPTPTHAQGYRRVITVSEPHNNEALIARVVVIPTPQK